MAWQTIDRNKPAFKDDAKAVLSDAVKDKIRAFFPRYETKRAVMLPALHIVQDAIGHISPKAMTEIAELLELHPADVFDVVGFYTHYWTHPRGEKVILCCRSITCDVLGADAVLDAFKKELGIDEHETTADGKFSLATEECLAGCDYGPCVLINERLHKGVKPEDVPALLKDANSDRIDVQRSDIFDGPKGQNPKGHGPEGHGPERQVQTAE